MMETSGVVPVSYDGAGMVLATPGLILKYPWCIAPSKKYAGRYYFYNSETLACEWRLDPSLVENGLLNGQRKEPLPKLKRRGGVPSREMSSGIRPLFRSASLKSAVPMETDEDTTQVHMKPRSDPLMVYKGHGAEVSQTNHEDLNAHHLIVSRGLGQGSFADVVEVKNSKTGKKYAMKVIGKTCVMDHKARERLSVELCAMTEMTPSPFVQRCYAAFESPTSIFFVVDLNSGGDLFCHLSSRFSHEHGWKFPEGESRVILAELALAIEHVHGQGYLHKDIKIENVMLDRNGHVKLVDFGLAEIMEAEVGFLEPTGSIVYMAPEMLRYHTVGRHTDWWAYGILAYELLTGCIPWSSFDNASIIENEIQSLEFRFPGHLSRPTVFFLGALLERDFKVRLGTRSDQEVNAAPFFSGINWDAMVQLKCEPAFVPGPDTISSNAMSKALASYLARSEIPGPGELPWYIGLDRVARHPPYRATAAKETTLPPLSSPRI